MASKWSSRIFHEPCGDHRNRDVFPLPSLKMVELQKGVRHTVQRRLRKLTAITKLVNRAIFSLNSLYFGGHSFNRQTVDDISVLPQSQRECIADLVKRASAFGAMPADASCQGALKALRASSGGYEEPEAGVGDVTPLSIDRLSLPSGKVAGVDLVDSLAEPLKTMVADFENWMLKDAADMSVVSEVAHKITPYNDPCILDRSSYLDLLRHLNTCGILSYTRRCRGRVGLFCVTKKPKIIEGEIQHRQRLILDCRQVNLSFKEPPRSELGSLASLCEIVLREKDTLYCGGSDIQDCFYAAKISDDLSSFFGLSYDLSTEDAYSIWGDDFCDDGCGNFVTPCISVLPMGFSWSFFLIQKLHEQSALRALGTDRSGILLDGYPSPDLHGEHAVALPYCDNIHSLALSQDLCNDGLRAMRAEVQDMGFTLHEDVDATDFFQTLGGIIDGKAGQIRPTSTRAWNILLAFESLLMGKVEWRTLQKLLGHAMTLTVLNRAGMSVFRALYDRVELQTRPCKLNRRERREVEIFIGLIPLLVGDLKRPWSTGLLCSDASPNGYGICERFLPSSDVEQLGRWQDRWRYRHLDPAEWQPRQRAAGRDVLGDISTARAFPVEYTVEDYYAYNNFFPEVPSDVLDPSMWHTQLMGKWRDTSEHITMKEGHALVLAARHLCRASKNRGKRHLILLDNFSLCMTVCKGRATNFGMLRTAQKLAALSLAGGFTLRVRWVPSEGNPADAPSRGQIRPGTYSPGGQVESTKGRSKAAGPETNSACEAFSEKVAQSVCSGEDSEKSGDCKEEVCDRLRSQEPSCCQTSQHPIERGISGGHGLGEDEWLNQAGTEISFSGRRESVCQLLPEVSEFLPGRRKATALRRAIGRAPGRLHGQALHGWSSRGGGREDPSKCGIPPCASQRTSGKRKKSASRMEKGEASAIQSAHPKDLGVWYQHAVDSQGVQNDGHQGHFGLRHLHEARGVNRPEGASPDSPGQRGRSHVQVAHSGSERLRRRKARQGRGVRQQHTPEFDRETVARRRAGSTCQGSEGSGGVHVPVQNGRLPEEVQPGGQGPGTEHSASISAQTWRGSRRPSSKVPRPCGGQKQRALGDRSKCSKVHKDWESTTTPDAIVTRRLGVLSMVTPESGEGASADSSGKKTLSGLTHVDVLSSRPLPHRFALEIFAGTARITRAFNSHGIATFPIDICLFPSHNVLAADVEHCIFNWIRSGRVTCIWCGMPCTTFSRARKFDGLGPEPLRTEHFLWGRPDLRYSDRVKVQTGNRLLLFSLRLLRLCEQFQIPYILENPYSSMAWEMSCLKRFVEQYHPSFVVLHYCQFGELWKKPTSLMHNYVDLSAVGVQCNTQQGLCSRTGRKHIPLSGVDANGCFMTLRAQPYPFAFCKQVATIVARALR